MQLGCLPSAISGGQLKRNTGLSYRQAASRRADSERETTRPWKPRRRMQRPQQAPRYQLTLRISDLIYMFNAIVIFQQDISLPSAVSRERHVSTVDKMPDIVGPPRVA